MQPMRVLGAGLVLWLLSAVPAAGALAHEVASGLARLGPRPADAPSQDAAVRLLLNALTRAGMKNVQALPVGSNPKLVNVTGVLPGEMADEIVLTAHYDTVEKSPGAGDDASGCGAVVGAAAALARTPLRHTVRVILFDGEELGMKGSRGWLASLPPGQTERIVANLNLEMVGWTGSPGPTIHSFPVKIGPDRVLAPAWLVDTLERSGEAVDWPYAMGDPRLPLLTQLVLRAGRVRLGADSNAFAEKGIPALSLSDSSLLSLDPAYHRPADVANRLDAGRLDRWSEAVAAAVRRMDILEGRPVEDDQYLMMLGRVWTRREIVGIGMALWVLLVFRDFQDRMRARPGERSMSGFVFRLLLVLLVLVAPVLSILLFPAALLALVPPPQKVLRRLWSVLGAVPLLLFAGALLAAYRMKLSGGLGARWEHIALLLVAILAFALAVLRPPKPPAPAPVAPASGVTPPAP